MEKLWFSTVISINPFPVERKQKLPILQIKVYSRRVWGEGVEDGESDDNWEEKNKSVLPPFMTYSWDMWILHLNLTFSWSQYCICKSKDFCIPSHSWFKCALSFFSHPVNTKLAKLIEILLYAEFSLFHKSKECIWYNGLILKKA